MKFNKIKKGVTKTIKKRIHTTHVKKRVRKKKSLKKGNKTVEENYVKYSTISSDCTLDPDLLTFFRDELRGVKYRIICDK